MENKPLRVETRLVAVTMPGREVDCRGHKEMVCVCGTVVCLDCGRSCMTVLLKFVEMYTLKGDFYYISSVQEIFQAILEWVAIF